MNKIALLAAVLLGAAVVGSSPGLAAMQGASYDIPVSTFAGGGGAASSPSYGMQSAVGQAAPIGISLSAGYQLRAGFFFAVPLGGGVTVPIGALELLLLQPSP